MKSEEKPEAIVTKQDLRNRKRAKSRKPSFMRQESWRYKRVEESWRRPRGIDSKMRKKVKGWPRSVGVGYRGPKKTRGLHNSGFAETLIFNMDDVEKVDTKTQAIRIAHNVGARKRVEISARAGERGIHILNPREIKELEVEGGKEEKATKEEETEQHGRSERI
ncbi:MAG: 50S ribosomal protein L32e [Candidatus Bathyarchaeota archaeon]|nr:MAG: 50S ribosomal protein L32e [Candidatus Bathyarchaeota archaeon]